MEESRTAKQSPIMTDERIIAYLLEELPEQEAENFEDECFALEDWPEQLSLVEEDLIEAYLRDELAPEQRRHFEQNYLSTPAREARVGVAAVLLSCINEREAEAPVEVPLSLTKLTWRERFRTFLSGAGWRPRAAFAVLLAASIVAVGWWGVRTRQPRTVLALSLEISFSDRAQAAQGRRVELGGSVSALRVSLLLPEAARGERYRVELESEGGEIKSLEAAAQDGQSVSVLIPAAQLPPGAYALKLFTVAADGTQQRIAGNYFFTVE